MIVPVFKYKAHFTRGLMKGMVMEQTMTFANEESAYDWCVRVNANERKGHCDYWVADFEKDGFKEIGNV
jgi:hypothetical protein